MRLLVVAAQVAMRRAEPGHAAEQMIERALARLPDPPLNVCTSIIVTLIGLESFGTLQRLCEDMMTAARRRSAVQEMIGIASFSAWALFRLGELADAESQARWALERATGIYAFDSLAHLAEILVERDALDVAEAELARMEPPVASHSIMAVTYLMARGQLRAAQQRHEEALRDFLACGERCALLGVVLAVYHWRSGAAVEHAWLGHADEARRLAREEVAIARAFGRPRALGVALRCEGLVEGLLGGTAGNGSHGLAILEEAVTVLASSQAPVELARAITDYGAVLRRAGRRTEARAQLERGLDLAHHWGARRIASRARAELVAAGAKPRRDAMTGRDALTASELRVARLAAAGRTNREIAQSLFITTKPRRLTSAGFTASCTSPAVISWRKRSPVPYLPGPSSAARRFPKAPWGKDWDGLPDVAGRPGLQTGVSTVRSKQASRRDRSMTSWALKYVSMAIRRICC